MRCNVIDSRRLCRKNWAVSEKCWWINHETANLHLTRQQCQTPREWRPNTQRWSTHTAWHCLSRCLSLSLPACLRTRLNLLTSLFLFYWSPLRQILRLYSRPIFTIFSKLIDALCRWSTLILFSDHSSRVVAMETNCRAKLDYHHLYLL